MLKDLENAPNPGGDRMDAVFIGGVPGGRTCILHAVPVLFRCGLNAECAEPWWGCVLLGLFALLRTCFTHAFTRVAIDCLIFLYQLQGGQNLPA